MEDGLKEAYDEAEAMEVVAEEENEDENDDDEDGDTDDAATAADDEEEDEEAEDTLSSVFEASGTGSKERLLL